MSYDKKDNEGVLFVNEAKSTDKHPDFKGSAIVGQQQFWVSGWKNTSKDGKKYIALKLTKKDLNKPAEKTETVTW